MNCLADQPTFVKETTDIDDNGRLSVNGAYQKAYNMVFHHRWLVRIIIIIIIDHESNGLSLLYGFNYREE
jgi:hypothetical protein